MKSMSEEQIPDEEGIYDDAHNGYETARVTIAPAKTDNEESMSLESSRRIILSSWLRPEQSISDMEKPILSMTTKSSHLERQARGSTC